MFAAQSGRCLPTPSGESSCLDNSRDGEQIQKMLQKRQAEQVEQIQKIMSSAAAASCHVSAEGAKLCANAGIQACAPKMAFIAEPLVGRGIDHVSESAKGQCDQVINSDSMHQSLDRTLSLGKRVGNYCGLGSAGNASEAGPSVAVARSPVASPAAPR